MLEHDRPDVLPSRPRMCERCGRVRDVEAPAHLAKELVCEECGAKSPNGRGWRAELASDDEGVEEVDLAVYCPKCWRDQFGD